MLTLNEVQATATELWRAHADEMPRLEEIRDYMLGKRGRPTLPDDPDEEIIELSRLAVKNVMPLVVDTFVDACQAIGFRSPSAESDTAAWSIWQRERMDARQSEVHRPAVQYGASYVLLEDVDGKVRFGPRSPRRMFAAYADPARDEWPAFALETWQVKVSGKAVRKGLLWDDEASYPVTINGSARTSRVTADEVEPTAHPFGVTPVVRFVNRGDVEDLLSGEVEPLEGDQRTLNAINFDRLVVSRFGAFPQKFIMGWAPETGGELAKLSARRVLAFEDSAQDVKAGSFASADVAAYNSLIDEQLAYIATKARVQVHSLTGKLSNVGTETIALIDSPNQRKSAAKRLRFGEAWEQALRKAAEREGVEVPDDAEMVWADTDARSFAQVVDGIVKLASQGVPIETLIDLVPGLSQQKVDVIADAIRVANSQSMAAQIVTAVRGAQTDARVA